MSFRVTYLISSIYTDDVISRNATLQSISTAHPKPSFLLWDKVYQKLSGEEEETWLLRASEAVLAFSKDEVLKDEHTRFVSLQLERVIEHASLICICSTSLGSIFLHLAVEGSSPQIRRSTLSTVERLAATIPEHINIAALAATSAYLSREKVSTKAAASSEDQDSAPNKEARLPAFLLACAAFGEDCPQDIKVRLLWDWVIVAHHPGHCESSLVPTLNGVELTSLQREIFVLRGSSCARRRRSILMTLSLPTRTLSWRRCSVRSTCNLRYAPPVVDTGLD